MSTYLGFEPTDQSGYYFVSYNNEDAERVAQLAGEMDRIGIPLWYDYGIEYGRKWRAQINVKISGARAMILFFTKGILLKDDSYVQTEYDIAKFLDKKIVVVMLDKIQPSDIPTEKLDWWLDIMNNQCLNAYLLNDRMDVIREIKRALGIRTAEERNQQLRRNLYCTWIVDCSGSMHGYKIQTVNFAVRDAVDAMKEMTYENQAVRLMIGTISFSDGARWVTPRFVEAEHYRWRDLSASGRTDFGEALKLVAEALSQQKPDGNDLPPVLVLLTDGLPTDDYQSVLNRIKHQKWWSKAVKIAIAIGEDVEDFFLEEFTGDPALILHGDDAGMLVDQIRRVPEIASESFRKTDEG